MIYEQIFMKRPVNVTLLDAIWTPFAGTKCRFLEEKGVLIAELPR
jgi:hypothetical protein